MLYIKNTLSLCRLTGVDIEIRVYTELKYNKNLYRKTFGNDVFILSEISKRVEHKEEGIISWVIDISYYRIYKSFFRNKI